MSEILIAIHQFPGAFVGLSIVTIIITYLVFDGIADIVRALRK